MATLDDWTQIPTNLLDLADKTQEAEQWASAQRAQLAETWANAQRNVLGAMANTWQQGTAALDNFRQGYNGTSVPSYNDMAGASSSYTATNPPQPTGGISALDQATSPLGPQWGDQSAIPLSAVPAHLAESAASSRAEHFGAQDAYTRYQLGMGPEPTPDQMSTAQSDLLNIGMAPAALELAGGTGNIIGRTALEQAPNLLKQLLGGAAPDLGNVAQGILGQDTTRMYHGTGSAFERPEPGKFDPNGLFGPGYYLTTSPEVASSYADMTAGSTKVNLTQRISDLQNSLVDLRRMQREGIAGPSWAKPIPQAIADTESELARLTASGPNVRAVDVPAGLRLLDADATYSPEQVKQTFTPLLPSHAQRSFNSAVDSFGQVRRGAIDGSTVYQLFKDQLGSQQRANELIQQAGYDGISYAGGKRIPLMDAQGQPIEHQAAVIFPNALDKLRNALSGTYGGLMDEAQAAKRTVTASEVRRPGAIGTENIALGQPQTTPTQLSPLAKVGRGALVGAGQGAIGGGIAASQEPGATPQSVALGALEGAPGGAVSGAVRAGLPAQLSTRLAAVASKEGFAGNIRLEKLPQDVRDVVTDAYNAAPQTFEDARRGVISDAQVHQLADQVGTSVQKIVDRWKPGQTQNAETLLALRNTLAAKAQDVVAAQQAVQTSNSAENLLKLQLALKEHGAVQEAVTGVTAEAGRALRQFRQSVTGAIASGSQQTMEDLLKKMGGREWTEELAQKFGQLDTTDPTQVGTFIRDIYKPKAADYLNEWYYNAILSAPPTHIANTVSNTLNALTSIPERALAGAIDEPLSRLQGREKTRFVGEAPALAYGMLRGLPEGVRAAAYTMAHGFSPEQALSGIKGEGFKGQAFKGPIGNAINIPSRLLSAADALAYPVLQRAQQNALIYRQAKAEGLIGNALTQRITDLTANVPANILEQSAKWAEYNLYRQPPKTIGQAAIKARGMNFLGVEPLRFVIPFLQVPINATKYGLERSPLGFINAARALATKDPAAADNLARAAIGSLVWGSVYAEVKAGNLDVTGAAPTAPAQRDAFYREGKLPFALKIGGKWYSYQRWEPFNHALTQVAAVVDAERNAKAGMSAADIAGQAALTEGINVESQTFLQGIGGLLNALSDPTRYGAQFVSQLETGPLPFSGLLRTGANLLDTRQRQPQGTLENVENVLPGLSQNVPARLNNYGEQQQQAGSPLLPYKAQQANLSPVDAELSKYGVEPGASGKTLRGMDLTRDEQRAYQITSGQTVKKLLTQVIADPRYQQADDATKAKILQRAITLAKDNAAQTYILQLAQQQGKATILQRIQQKKLASLPKAG